MDLFGFFTTLFILRRSCTMRNCVCLIPFACARYVDALVASLTPSYFGTKRRFETALGVWHSSIIPNSSNLLKVFSQNSSFSSDINRFFSCGTSSSISSCTLNFLNFPTSNLLVAKHCLLSSIILSSLALVSFESLGLISQSLCEKVSLSLVGSISKFSLISSSSISSRGISG